MRQAAIIITLFISLLSIEAFGQTFDDYIVQLNGDTLRGKVDLLQPEAYSESVLIKIGKNQIRFTANKVVRLYIDSTYYSSIRNGNKYQIMRELVSGYLSLYEMRVDNVDFEAKYLFKKTGEGIQVPPLTFKKSVSKFIQECPEISEKVKNKEYKFSAMEQLVADYNSNCMNLNYNPVEDTIINEDSKQTKILALIERLIDTSDTENSLLIDLKKKIVNNEEVPGYMISALQAEQEKYSRKAFGQLMEYLEDEE